MEVVIGHPKELATKFNNYPVKAFVGIEHHDAEKAVEGCVILSKAYPTDMTEKFMINFDSKRFLSIVQSGFHDEFPDERYEADHQALSNPKSIIIPNGIEFITKNFLSLPFAFYYILRDTGDFTVFGYGLKEWVKQGQLERFDFDHLEKSNDRKIMEGNLTGYDFFTRNERMIKEGRSLFNHPIVMPLG